MKTSPHVKGRHENRNSPKMADGEICHKCLPPESFEGARPYTSTSRTCAKATEAASVGPARALSVGNPRTKGNAKSSRRISKIPSVFHNVSSRREGM